MLILTAAEFGNSAERTIDGAHAANPGPPLRGLPLIDAARTIREIVNGTKVEVYEIAAESGVDYLKSLGLDIAEGLAEDVDKVAATTTCLFFGFLDGATTISESCGGGGGNNELPKKKDNEDELFFALRCHQMAKTMHASKYRLRR